MGEEGRRVAYITSSSISLDRTWSSVSINLQGRLESTVFIQGGHVPAKNYREEEEENRYQEITSNHHTWYFWPLKYPELFFPYKECGHLFPFNFWIQLQFLKVHYLWRMCGWAWPPHGLEFYELPSTPYIYIEYIKKTSICRKKEWGICSSHWFRSVTRSYCREVIKAPWCGFVITSLYPLTLSSAHSPRFALWVLRYPLSSVTISDVDMPSLGTALLLQSILVRLGAWELLQGVIRYRVFSLTWVGISLAVQFSYKIHRSSVFLLLVIP